MMIRQIFIIFVKIILVWEAISSIIDNTIDLMDKTNMPGHKHKPDMDKGNYELRVEHKQEDRRCNRYRRRNERSISIKRYIIG